MAELIISLKAALAGAVLGGVCQKLKLPLPAPPVLAGVMGIFGVLLGGKIAGLFF
ncbi:XapX domain-containing protein [Tepidibacter formicigenes]|jgi:XapX domain-containing protein|uniref:XapX domain-containing protein n=1 Tax=Tepidibacter formicigenes DSM 15518 TaxID=1123349 RepID=A0A1M6PFP9_9FIRM|nr:XapX domain-containing protein [Tepidibacter formicigenes]SHK06779.1 XapX domain-containing protein [Tepidibacter formicigenes DSM 15518]